MTYVILTFNLQLNRDFADVIKLINIISIDLDYLFDTLKETYFIAEPLLGFRNLLGAVGRVKLLVDNRQGHKRVHLVGGDAEDAS